MARNGKAPRRLGAAGQRHGVVVFDEAFAAHRHADMGVVMEDDAFRLHLLDAPVDMALFELEVGNAVAEQAARPGVLLIDVNLVAGAGELLRAGEARGP